MNTALLFTEPLQQQRAMILVNLKSNSALLYNKGHHLLTSAFYPKNSPKLIIALIASLLRQEGKQAIQNKTDRQTEH